MTNGHPTRNSSSPCPWVHVSHTFVQNMCTKLVLNKKKYDSATEALRTLHWLHIKSHIVFKLLLTVHKCQQDVAPKYLKSLLINPPDPVMNLSSRKVTTRLIVSHNKLKTFADRSFSVVGQKLLNKLPEYLYTVDNTTLFKAKLKTFLFDNNLWFQCNTS